MSKANAAKVYMVHVNIVATTNFYWWRSFTCDGRNL